MDSQHTSTGTPHGPTGEWPLGVSGFCYRDLYDPERLKDLHQAFLEYVHSENPDTGGRFDAYRQSGGEGTPQEISGVLVDLAPYVSKFLARLFGIETERDGQSQAIRAEVDCVFTFRNKVVAAAAKRYRGEDAAGWDLDAVRQRFAALTAACCEVGELADDPEYAVSRLSSLVWKLASHFAGLEKGKPGVLPDAEEAVAGLRAAITGHPQGMGSIADLLQPEDDGIFCEGLLDCISRWCHVAEIDPDIAAQVRGWVSFKAPEKTNFENLVRHEVIGREGYSAWVAPAELRRHRVGFGLTDKRFGEREVLYEVDHCIYCHERDTDSCAKGMRQKKESGYKVGALGDPATGCPLEEKISEALYLKNAGDNIAALAVVVVDNPMVPGTGHRICNDCMKACIYQKTEPVNIPQIETNVLTDVLFMPYGFEIYSLLTRWNPLNVKRPYVLPYNGKNVLIVGMGPAGYTLAHFLMNEGFAVTGIDGLKIEPLPPELTGSNGTPPEPIRDFNEHYEDLDQRIMRGFGGVAEYGITVRWDKNFLNVIYLTLARRNKFSCYGGVRFGGTLDIDDTWEMGFDHIAIATGAGKPTIIGLKNNLVRGIRKASDFLMALQLTGAAKDSSLANLQVRLPAGVIGGGLTAIDTTTELQAYYPAQVRKILRRYETLAEKYGEDGIRGRYDAEELQILDEFLDHGRACAAEVERARAAGEQPDLKALVDAWGGVTMFYRKLIRQSPSYRQNHEEIREALAEGITIAEHMNPLEAIVDEYGHLEAVRFEKVPDADEAPRELLIPLRGLFVAAGTSPNTIYQSEHPGTFEMDGKFYRRFDLREVDEDFSLEAVDDTPWPKIGSPAPLTSYHQEGRYITFYGDNHPVYAGNVVKAMASARDGYPAIVKLFENELQALDPDGQERRDQALALHQEQIAGALCAEVVEVKRLTPTIIEVIVRAPMQAQKFSPGQFYRVQNLESRAPVVEGTVLAAEGLALTGAWVDKDQGLISLITLEMGSSSRLCALWQPGDPLVVMGVTGAPTEIPSGKAVLLAGGGLGNAVLFSIGKALRAAGNQVLYFAGYKHGQDVFKVEDIEAAADVVVWSVDPAPGVEPLATRRPQDKSFVGNIIEAMLAYGKGELGGIRIDMGAVEHVIIIGSDRMLAALKDARFGALEPYLKRGHTAIASINSPMQCMMKGVCAQCLCKHVDPESGEPYFVYSCYNQDQEIDRVDFDNLNARLRQNSVQEKLSDQWLNYLFETNDELQPQ